MSWIETFSTFEKINKLSNVSTEVFLDGYGYCGKPVVISDIVTSWKAFKLWTPRYLTKYFGGLDVSAMSTNGGSRFAKMTVSDYLVYMNDTDDEFPYYLANCQFHLGTHLEKHYSVPEFFKCWYRDKANKETLSWLFIGAARTRFPFHVDRWFTSAWNALLSGTKYWIFFATQRFKRRFRREV